MTHEPCSKNTGQDKPSPRAVIDEFLRQVLGIRLCAREIIPKSQESQQHGLEKCLTNIRTATRGLKTKNLKRQADSLSRVVRECKQLDIYVKAPQDRLLCESLFRCVFSTFDAFVGKLLRCLYERNSNLLRASERSLQLSKLLDLQTLGEAKAHLIEEDIESLLRDSYPESFKKLASRFGLNTLTEFANWPHFVEASQRRNIITHCDGIVNRQYVLICKREQVDLSDECRPGVRLSVDTPYLDKSLALIYEVGLKLGQVLWRKACPQELAEADDHLAESVVEVLTREEWELGKCLAEFSVALPKHSSGLLKRIMIINYAQSILWAGDRQGAIAELDKHDWTGTIRDLRLAVAVLKNDLDVAVRLMNEIGRNGELIDCHAYVDWPIFREFRQHQGFRQAFKRIYGTRFEERAQSLENERVSESERIAREGNQAVEPDGRTRKSRRSEGQEAARRIDDRRNVRRKRSAS